MASFSFKGIVAGLPLLLRTLKGVRAGIVAFIGKRRIEQYLVARTKARFEQRGSNPLAQRAPSGRFWAFVKQSTVDSRKSKQNKSRYRALFDTGRLQNAISITKKGPGLAVVGRSGTFVVGVNAGTKATKYALFHQQGGITPKGGIVPARPFLGIGPTEEKELAIMGLGLIEKHMQ